MTRPLVAIIIVFCAGIMLASQINISFLWYYLLATTLLFLSQVFKKNASACAILILLLVLLTGAMLYKNQKVLPADHISKFLRYKDRGYSLIKGYICQEPESDESGKAKFIFQAQEIQSRGKNYRCRGYVLVYCGNCKGLDYGAELILRGKLSHPFRWSNSFKSSYSDYLHQRGIYAVTHIKSSMDLIILSGNRGNGLKKIALKIKNKIAGLTRNYLANPAASVMNAMILGDKKDIPGFIYESMVNTGTVHILVVSGFNVGLVAYILNIFLKLIRIPRKARFYLIVPILVMYCLVTGFSAPVLRATLMAIILLLAYLLQREPDIGNICALSALAILIFNPNQLFDIGFQLSFVSVISIIFLNPLIRSLVRADKLKSKALKYLADSFLVSLAAWLATAGFIAYYFNTFSLITVLANLFVVPLASFITISGFVLSASALFFPPLAYPFAYASGLAINLMLKVNLFLAGLPFSHFNLPC
jgi:competence protein ComEC